MKFILWILALPILGILIYLGGVVLVAFLVIALVWGVCTWVASLFGR